MIASNFRDQFEEKQTYLVLSTQLVVLIQNFTYFNALYSSWQIY